MDSRSMNTGTRWSSRSRIAFSAWSWLFWLTTNPILLALRERWSATLHPHREGAGSQVALLSDSLTRQLSRLSRSTSEAPSMPSGMMLWCWHHLNCKD